MAGEFNYPEYNKALRPDVTDLAKAYQTMMNEYLFYSNCTFYGYASPEAWASFYDSDGRREKITQVLTTLAVILKPHIDSVTTSEMVDSTRIRVKLDSGISAQEECRQLIEHVLRLFSVVSLLQHFDALITKEVGKEGSTFSPILDKLNLAMTTVLKSHYTIEPARAQHMLFAKALLQKSIDKMFDGPESKALPFDAHLEHLRARDGLYYTKVTEILGDYRFYAASTDSPVFYASNETLGASLLRAHPFFNSVRDELRVGFAHDKADWMAEYQRANDADKAGALSAWKDHLKTSALDVVRQKIDDACSVFA